MEQTTLGVPVEIQDNITYNTFEQTLFRKLNGMNKFEITIAKMKNMNIVRSSY